MNVAAESDMSARASALTNLVGTSPELRPHLFEAVLAALREQRIAALGHAVFTVTGLARTRGDAVDASTLAAEIAEKLVADIRAEML